MDLALETFLNKMRSQGEGDHDLAFSCTWSEARRYRMVPNPQDRGLVALSKAVESGAVEVSLLGDNRASCLIYGDQTCHLGPGAFSQVLRRGALAPTRLSVNGRPLVAGFRPPLYRQAIRPVGNLLGGVIDLLPAGRRGQVELVDRGISFQLGPLFGAIRVIAQVAPLQGAPWPTRLLLTPAVQAVVGQIWEQVRELNGQRCHL
jgi:hypothetical protein